MYYSIIEYRFVCIIFLIGQIELTLFKSIYYYYYKYQI